VNKNMNAIRRGPNLILTILFLFLAASLHAESLHLERLAQYNLNYASYLIDVGKYLEALESYETAYEVSQHPKTKARALLHKASLLSNFLDSYQESIKTYDQILKEYPTFAETALYQKGLLLFHLKRYQESIEVFDRYMKVYPEGTYQFSIEILRQKAQEALEKPPPPKPKPVERPVVRVALSRKTRVVNLSGDNLEVIADGRIKIRGSKLTITPSGQGMTINHKSLKGSKIEVRGKSNITFSSPRKKKIVRGKLLIVNKGGFLLVINMVDIEKYLYSVVPSESYASWPLETLKAQAVAARTYALYQIRHRQDWDYDLVDYAGDQAYEGVSREHPRTTQAVNETCGLTLEYNGRPILAMYTANSGGFTADPQYVFSMKLPYMTSREDPASKKGKMATWTRNYPISEVEKRLRNVGCHLKGIKDIRPHTVSPSGRIIKVRVYHSEGENVLRTWSTVRRALELPEILLNIERRGHKIIFEGKGWGHGIGYSQEGGAILGKRNDYKHILRFYYPKAKLVKNW